MMSHKLKLTKLLFLFILFTNLVNAAQTFPDHFYMKYELTQSSKFVGTMTVEYISKKNNYSLKAVTKGQGILRLLGDRVLYSKGTINNKGFSPKRFEVKNIKKPKKDIIAIFQPSLKKIEIKYKGEKSLVKMKPKNLDLAIYLYQFNFEKKNQKKYNFSILEGKKIREYEYKRIKDEMIEFNNKAIATVLYEGRIINKENSGHHVWISKGEYRVPLKLRLGTNFGLTINQKIVETNLPL